MIGDGSRTAGSAACGTAALSGSPVGFAGRDRGRPAKVRAGL